MFILTFILSTMNKNKVLKQKKKYHSAMKPNIREVRYYTKENRHEFFPSEYSDNSRESKDNKSGNSNY